MSVVFSVASVSFITLAFSSIAADGRPTSNDVTVRVNPTDDSLLADAFDITGVSNARTLRLRNGVVDPGTFYGE